MRLRVRCLLFSLALVALPAAAMAQGDTAGAPPVAVPFSHQYDLKSTITSEQYRLMVMVPPGVNGVLPVLYVLDGDGAFLSASHAALTQALSGQIRPGLIVGVGYGTTDAQEILRRRTFDLTPSESLNATELRKTGGGEAFLRVLQDEIIPFIAARYRVDAARQAVFGHSLAGLLVLHAFLRAPERFANWIVSSPSIWWNDRAVEKVEEGLAARLKTTATPPRVLVLSAADEQYRGDDPARRAADNRLVDNASDLTERLRRVSPSLVVEREIFPNEGHVSVVPAALSRAVRFAFAK